MRAIEFINEAVPARQLGRAFNHLEDLVFFYGSAGTIEALEHLKDFNSQIGSDSIRMKWDGNPQIYWGRERGKLVPPHGHNQWSKGVVPGTGAEVANFIMDSGKAVTAEEIASRQQFANKFASLAPLFANATPPEISGNNTYYVYADALFLSPPPLQDGVYTFCPNPKSQTCYHVRADSELGIKISRAKIMVVGHAFFTQHGQPDTAQIPIKDFSSFNTNPDVIVLGPIYNVAPVAVDNRKIDQVESYIRQHATDIDTFLLGTAGVSDLRNIIYTYVNQTAKAKQLDSIGVQSFFAWAESGKISTGKLVKIRELDQMHNGALEKIMRLLKAIQQLKDDVIAQIEAGPKAEIWDTNGEGRVRYGTGKQFGNVKLVPRKRWTPA
jgi:hypothetical protein